MKNDVISETTKAMPALAGAWITKMTLNEWIAVATGIYIVIQAVYLLRKWYREEKSYQRRGGRSSG